MKAEIILKRIHALLPTIRHEISRRHYENLIKNVTSPNRLREIYGCIKDIIKYNNGATS
jgi:hypothetical protein